MNTIVTIVVEVPEQIADDVADAFLDVIQSCSPRHDGIIDLYRHHLIIERNVPEEPV